MDDYNGNPFDFDEIDKIQSEIDKDLLTANTEAEQNDIYSSENNIDGENPEVGIREIVEDSIISMDCGQNEAAGSLSESGSFFKETVKSESRKQSGGKFKRIVALACVVSVLVGISAGIAIPIAEEFLIPRLKGETHATAVPAESPNFTFLSDALPAASYEPMTGVLSFADLISAVEPSVVCITVKIPADSSSNLFQSQAEEASPMGSGIIFDKDDEKLYIVTNNHVVSGASSVGVSVEGSDDVPAKLVGKDADADLAVISIEINDLRRQGMNDFVIAAFANSHSMRVGDFVIAIGNALGEGNAATFGFVSKVDKEINVYGKPFTVIQTDAAINPGNSGGPLINLKGEVIGINMVKFVEAKVEGTGYALTSDVAMPIIEQIRNQTAKPILGISGFDMTETVAKAYSLPMMGVVVDSVLPGTGAEKAGIKSADVITSFNGQTVINMSQLKEEVQKCNIGDKVEVKLIRDGKEPLTLEVTLLEDNNANF